MPSRPGGPPAKRQPSPEGLDWNPHHDPERHRRGTHAVLNQSAASRNRGWQRFCRGSAGISLPGSHTYAIYLPHGGDVTIQLQPGQYSAYWFNAMSGEKIDLPPVEAKIWTSPVAPDRNDWVTAASQTIGLQERIVEIHYTHPALRLNINNNS